MGVREQTFTTAPMGRNMSHVVVGCAAGVEIPNVFNCCAGQRTRAALPTFAGESEAVRRRRATALGIPGILRRESRVRTPTRCTASPRLKRGSQYIVTRV